MEINTILLWTITIMVAIILIVMLYAIFALQPLIITGQKISNGDYSSVRPLTVDVIRNIAIPETNNYIKQEFVSSFDSIKKFIEEILKKK